MTQAAKVSLNSSGKIASCLFQLHFLTAAIFTFIFIAEISPVANFCLSNFLIFLNYANQKYDFRAQ